MKRNQPRFRNRTKEFVEVNPTDHICTFGINPFCVAVSDKSKSWVGFQQTSERRCSICSKKWSRSRCHTLHAEASLPYSNLISFSFKNQVVRINSPDRRRSKTMMVVVLAFGLDSLWVPVCSWHWLLCSGSTNQTKPHWCLVLQLSHPSHQLSK